MFKLACGVALVSLAMLALTILGWIEARGAGRFARHLGYDRVASDPAVDCLTIWLGGFDTAGEFGVARVRQTIRWTRGHGPSDSPNGPMRPGWRVEDETGIGARPFADVPGQTVMSYGRFGAGVAPERPARFGGPPSEGQWLRVPAWTVAAVFAVWPVTVAAWVWRRRRHRAAGRCPRCGYDLRASPDRCPECGAGGAPAGRGA